MGTIASTQHLLQFSTFEPSGCEAHSSLEEELVDIQDAIQSHGIQDQVHLAQQRSACTNLYSKLRLDNDDSLS